MTPSINIQTSLYLVPTPIGNLEDITLRALKVLKEVDIILAEDTRTSGKLLKHFEIDTKVQSHHMHNEHKTVESLVSQMLDGKVFALISDAGTPAISDPGYLLVREALTQNVKVECLPGATAFVPALVKSGLPCHNFVFEGFLPPKKGRQTKMKELLLESRTVVFYESPHRLVKTLKQLEELSEYAERKVSVSRELTKMFEETFTGTFTETIRHFSSKEVKGEIVIVLEGKS